MEDNNSSSSSQRSKRNVRTNVLLDDFVDESIFNEWLVEMEEEEEEGNYYSIYFSQIIKYTRRDKQYTREDK